MQTPAFDQPPDRSCRTLSALEAQSSRVIHNKNKQASRGRGEDCSGDNLSLWSGNWSCGLILILSTIHEWKAKRLLSSWKGNSFSKCRPRITPLPGNVTARFWISSTRSIRTWMLARKRVKRIRVNVLEMWYWENRLRIRFAFGAR